MEKGFYNFLCNVSFLPSTLPPNLKRSVEAQFIYDLTGVLCTYRVESKFTPVVQIFYSSNGVRKEMQMPLV